jgi:hypothetical protein
MKEIAEITSQLRKVGGKEVFFSCHYSRAEFCKRLISSQLRSVGGWEEFFCHYSRAEICKRLWSPVLEFWNNLWVLGTVPFSLSQSSCMSPVELILTGEGWNSFIKTTARKPASLRIIQYSLI